MKEEERPIKFSDLSIWVKIALVGGWVSILAFLYGFLGVILL